MIYSQTEKEHQQWHLVLSLVSVVGKSILVLLGSSIFSLSGAIVGPIVSGFIVQNLGVKYVFIIMSAFCGAGAVIGIPLLRETYAPVIRMRMGKSSPDLEDVTQAHAPKSKFVFWHILWLNLCRPVRLLSDSFLLFILALYLAL
jgi:MFS family permease